MSISSTGPPEKPFEKTSPQAAKYQAPETYAPQTSPVSKRKVKETAKTSLERLPKEEYKAPLKDRAQTGGAGAAGAGAGASHLATKSGIRPDIKQQLIPKDYLLGKDKYYQEGVKIQDEEVAVLSERTKIFLDKRHAVKESEVLKLLESSQFEPRTFFVSKDEHDPMAFNLYFKTNASTNEETIKQFHCYCHPESFRGDRYVTFELIDKESNFCDLVREEDLNNWLKNYSKIDNHLIPLKSDDVSTIPAFITNCLKAFPNKHIIAFTPSGSLYHYQMIGEMESQETLKKDIIAGENTIDIFDKLGTDPLVSKAEVEKLFGQGR